MAGTKEYKHKLIKRIDHTGAMVNYGRLEVGIVGGIRCLGSKETLLLIGAGLAKQKVPDYFYTREYLSISLSSTMLKVYALKGLDIPELASRVAGRPGVKCVNVIDDVTGESEIAIHDEAAASQSQVKLEWVSTKKRFQPHGKVSKLKKVWLVIKRLFSWGE